MIGVIVDDGELAIIREFFELFKTPWEPYRRGRRYPVVVTGSPEAALPDAELTIVYGLDPDNKRSRIDPELPVNAELLRYRDQNFPVYCGCSSIRGPGKAIVTREDSDQVVGLQTVTPRGKIVRIGYDLVGQIRFILSVGQPARYARIPTLDLHIAILRDLIVEAGIPLVEIPPVPLDYDLILCLTHDVDFISIRQHGLDRTVLGFLYRATIISLLRCLKGQLSLRKLLRNMLAVLTLPLIHLGLVRDLFSQFKGYLDLEGNHRSTFFLVPYKNINGHACGGRQSNGRATRYDVGDVAPEIFTLISKGCEVGLHGLDAWHSSGRASIERARIHRIAGTQPVGIRMHWLFYSEETPQVLENAGFIYDSSWGYNDGAGFRAGTSQAFRPPGVAKLLELPLQVQDTALFASGRMGLNEKEGIQLIDELVETIRRTGGVITVNWHMRSLGPERLWDEPFRYLLRVAEDSRVWTAPACEVMQWFAMRRSVRLTAGNLDPAQLCAIPADSEYLPSLQVRRYNCADSDMSEVDSDPSSSRPICTG